MLNGAKRRGTSHHKNYTIFKFFLSLNSKTFILKLFRYIVPILFLFCSVVGKGQEDTTKFVIGYKIDSSYRSWTRVAGKERYCDSCNCFFVVVRAPEEQDDFHVLCACPSSSVVGIRKKGMSFILIKPDDYCWIPNPNNQFITILTDVGRIKVNWAYEPPTKDSVFYDNFYKTTCVNIHGSVIDISYSDIPQMNDYIFTVDLQPCDSKSLARLVSKYKKGKYKPPQATTKPTVSTR